MWRPEWTKERRRAPAPAPAPAHATHLSKSPVTNGPFFRQFNTEFTTISTFWKKNFVENTPTYSTVHRFPQFQFDLLSIYLFQSIYTLPPHLKMLITHLNINSILINSTYLDSSEFSISCSCRKIWKLNISNWQCRIELTNSSCPISWSAYLHI